MRGCVKCVNSHENMLIYMCRKTLAVAKFERISSIQSNTPKEVNQTSSGRHVSGEKSQVRTEISELVVKTVSRKIKTDTKIQKFQKTMCARNQPQKTKLLYNISLIPHKNTRRSTQFSKKLRPSARDVITHSGFQNHMVRVHFLFMRPRVNVLSAFSRLTLVPVMLAMFVSCSSVLKFFSFLFM